MPISAAQFSATRHLRPPASTGARQFVRCVLPLVSVIGLGTVGFYLVEEELSLWESLYFTLITITTVGYEQQVSSDAARVLIVVLLVLGIGTFTYTLGEVMRSALNFQSVWMRRMQSRIDQLEGHVIVCGYGRMGRSISARLAGSGASVVVIEQDPQGWQDAIDQGYLAVRGCGTDDAMLRQAGVDRAAGAACVMDTDADNTFCVLSVRELNERAFIACRADSQQSVHKLERAGATFVVCPYAHAGIDVANALLDPNHAQLYQSGPRSEYGFEISEMQIVAGSILDGRTIAEFGQHANSIVFVALRRPGQEQIIRPGGDEQFLAGDVVVAAGKVEELSCVLELAQSRAVEAA